MQPKFIPTEESFARWKKDPSYVAAYESLQEEFALASAMNEAKGDADSRNRLNPDQSRVR